MTEKKALEKLRGLIRWGYSQTNMAMDAGVSTAYVNAVLMGHKTPSNKLLKLIGVEKKVTRKVVIQTDSDYSADA